MVGMGFVITGFWNWLLKWFASLRLMVKLAWWNSRHFLICSVLNMGSGQPPNVGMEPHAGKSKEELLPQTILRAIYSLLLSPLDFQSDSMFFSPTKYSTGPLGAWANVGSILEVRVFFSERHSIFTESPYLTILNISYLIWFGSSAWSGLDNI